jgi:glycosyltransferase involved in cell wall biosynthesis
MRFSANLLSAPPLRYIGAELMTLEMLGRLQSRGHDITVHVRDVKDPHTWGGLRILPEGPFEGALIFHADYFEPAQAYSGKRIAICHNERIHVQVGLINGAPDLVTVNSRAMQQSLGGVIVHPPVPEAPLLSGDRVTIINLDWNKVGSFWGIAKRMPEQEFLAVKGGYGEQIVRGRPNCEVIDHVPFGSMDEKVWSRTRVLVVPSRSESWSMVASEAMMRGIPVVASNLPGLAENVGPGGVLVTGENPDQWASAVRHVLDKWDSFSAAARSRALEQSAEHDRELDLWCEEVEKVCRS